MRRFLAALLCLALLTGCAISPRPAPQTDFSALGSAREQPPPPAIVAESEEAGEETQEESPPLLQDDGRFRYARSFLRPEMQSAYDTTVAQALQFEVPTHAPAGSLTNEDLQALSDAIMFDNPRLYWLRFSAWGDSSGGNRAFVGDLAEGDTLEEVRRRDSELTQAAEAILQSAGGDDYAVSMAVHDALALSCEYDNSFMEQDIYNAYGALVRGKAVCDGFAKSYQLVMDLAGIPCVYVCGSTNRSRDETHAWNAVQLDGEWYYTDVTWDIPEDGLPLRREYLHATSREIDREHVPQPGQYPELPSADSDKMSYYVRNGRAVVPGGEDFTGQLAEAFWRQLADNPGQTDEGELYLEIKLLCSENEFAAAKQFYSDQLRDILIEIQSLADESRQTVQTNGEIRYKTNDATQILTLMLPAT